MEGARLSEEIGHNTWHLKKREAPLQWVLVEASERMWRAHCCKKGKRRRGQQMTKVRGPGETKRPMTTARPALPRFAHCWRSGSTHARKERGGVGYVTTRGPGLRKLGDIHLRARCVPLTSTPSQGRHREKRAVCALWCVASTARVPMRATGISVWSFELEAF